MSEAASTTNTHRVRWFVYSGSERIPHTSTMRGSWGYDASCSCGWDSSTGGAVKRYVREQVYFHTHYGI